MPTASDARRPRSALLTAQLASSLPEWIEWNGGGILMTMSGPEQVASAVGPAPSVQPPSAQPPAEGVLIDGYRYLHAPTGVHFPVSEQVPEGKPHFELRALLYQSLQLAFAHEAAIGSDQFVYWDPTDPRACLAPDVFVRLGQADDLFQIWKVWERGAPQVAVEIISDTDRSHWESKLLRYRRLGVAELVRFDAESTVPMRIWDRVEEELVERQPSGLVQRSRYLPGFWLAVEQARLGLTLRLGHDEQGARLFPSPTEEAQGRRIEAEGRRIEAEGRRIEAEGRRIAEARILELEAELRRRTP